MSATTKHHYGLDLAALGVRPLARLRAARRLDQIIFVVLLILTGLVAVLYGTVEPWWEGAFESSIFILTALRIVEGYLSGSWRIGGRHLLLPFAAIIGLALIQTLPVLAAETRQAGGAIWKTISADPYETRRFVFKLLALVLSGELLLRYTSSPQRLRVLIYLVIGIGLACAFFGIARQMAQQGRSGFVLPHLMPEMGYGQFINRNHFAFLMEMTLGLLVGLVVAGGVPRNRLLFYAALALPMWVALILTNSRGGILSMLAQVLFIALFLPFLPRQKSRAERTKSISNRLRRIGMSVFTRVLLIVCLLIALAGSIAWVGGDAVADRWASIPDETTAQSLDGRRGVRRIEIWRATWQLIKENPILGVGFGGYWVAITRHHNSSGDRRLQQAHNEYLELLASSGVVGTAFVLWLIIAFASHARARLRSSDPFRRAACFGAVIAILTIAVHSFFDFGLHTTVNALMLVCLVVIINVDYQTNGYRLVSREMPATMRTNPI